MGIPTIYVESKIGDKRKDTAQVGERFRTG